MRWNKLIIWHGVFVTLLLPALATGQEILVAEKSDWRFLDDGSDQGVIWTLEIINDSSWDEGPAPLGYGNNDIETTVDFGGNSQQKHITTYFRRSFNITDSSLYDSLTLRLRRDDGAIVYLNGSEVMRSNLSSCGDIDFQTTAADAINGADENTFIEKNIPSSLLMDGTNLIAVEIHQVNDSDADLIFDLELTGNGVPANKPPTVTLTAPAADAVFNLGDTITCEATASDDDGQIDRVEFFADGNNLIGSDTTSPYTATWSDASSGNYTLTAVAYDDDGEATTSTTVNISVNPANQAPTVAISQPLEGTDFDLGETINIQAIATDDDGEIERVRFFANGTFIADDTTSDPYSATWSNASAGNYALTAIARDNDGAETTSATVNISVTDPANQPPMITLTDPLEGSLLIEGTQITISASANDTDGSIARVEFFVDSILLTEDTAAPYNASWQTSGLGAHTLTAIAYDNAGASTNAEAISISVAGQTGSPIFLDNFE